MNNPLLIVCFLQEHIGRTHKAILIISISYCRLLVWKPLGNVMCLVIYTVDKRFVFFLFYYSGSPTFSYPTTPTNTQPQPRIQVKAGKSNYK